MTAATHPHLNVLNVDTAVIDGRESTLITIDGRELPGPTWSTYRVDRPDISSSGRPTR